MPRKSWHSLPEYQTLRVMMESDTTAAAARRLGLSQSAVSRSLSSLENRIGKVLFERNAGRLKPTEAAVQFNARLDSLFEALDWIDGPTGQDRDQLNIIAPPTFSGRFLAEHMATFMKSHPEYFLSLEVGTSEDVINGIRNDKFDLGIVGVEPNRAGTKLIPFRLATAVCAMQPDHPLAELKVIEPETLHEQDLIALSRRHARRSQLEKLFHESSVAPNIVAEVSSSVAAAELVLAGLGVAVINPFPIANQYAGKLVLRPFTSAYSYQSYFAIPENRPVSRIARHFMRHVRLHTPRDEFSHVV